MKKSERLDILWTRIENRHGRMKREWNSHVLCSFRTNCVVVTEWMTRWVQTKWVAKQIDYVRLRKERFGITITQWKLEGKEMIDYQAVFMHEEQGSPCSIHHVNDGILLWDWEEEESGLGVHTTNAGIRHGWTEWDVARRERRREEEMIVYEVTKKRHRREAIWKVDGHVLSMCLEMCDEGSYSRRNSIEMSGFHTIDWKWGSSVVWLL